MQYVNGHDIASQNIKEVHTLALSNKIPWVQLQQESDAHCSIYDFSANDKGIYLSKGVSEFSISPENMYELLYNISERKKWDTSCVEAIMLEEYDHLNHIVQMQISHPLGVLNMHLYRSCKYEPQSRLYIIAMRSIELEDSEVDSFECLPNGWVIQGVDGHKDRCRLIFVQQCHLRDIELQKIPGYKNFTKTKEHPILNYHYLTIFPATVSGRLGRIFECIRNHISNNVREIETKDTRLKIMEQAERELNEYFGTTTVDYGWSSYLKKYDMELLVKKSGDIYYMVGKGSFSSTFSPSKIGDLLYSPQPWSWDTFYDKGLVVQDINENCREVDLYYRMWYESFSMKVLQSVKKGPGNCSSVIWRSICTSDVVNENDMELSFLPSGIFSYGLGEGSFTSFLVVIAVKGAKTPQQEHLVSKLFAARIISTQNHIINTMNRSDDKMEDEENLPVIPTVNSHCNQIGLTLTNAPGVPSEFSSMIENFANLLLSDSIIVNKKKSYRNAEDSSKSKRKRNFVDESVEQQQVVDSRPTIRITTNIISHKMNCNDGMVPKMWNSSKRQPFLFLVSEKNHKQKLRRKDVSITNSNFDTLPEEIVQLILSFLKANDILSVSMVCKRFKMATDSSSLWKQLYLLNPIFNKSVPKKYRPIQQMLHSGCQNTAAPTQTNPGLEQFITMISRITAPASGENSDEAKLKPCGCSPACICPCSGDCNCECLNEETMGVSNWRTQYLHKIKLADRWSTAKPKKMIEMTGHNKAIRCLKAEGNSAVSVSTDKKAKFWNLNSGQCIGTYEETGTNVVSIDYDRSAKSSYIWPLTEYTRVHIGHKNGTVTLVDFMNIPYQSISTERPVLLADGFDFSNPGKYVIWEGNHVECWEEEKKARLWASSEHTKKINQAKSISSSLFANGIVCTSSSDKTLKIRNIMDGNLITTLTSFQGSVNCIEAVGDHMIVSGSSDKLLRLWDLRQLANPLIVNSGHTGAIKCLSYEEKGGRILSGGDDGVVVIWNLDNWYRGRRECLGVPNTPVPDNDNNSNKIIRGTCSESGRLSRPGSGGITCIDSDEAGFVCGTANGTIVRWDFA